MAEWDDQDFLLRVWRRRDASLLRLLTARNLEMIRSKFDEEQAASKKQGLSVADFVRVMMKLVGPMAINQEELCMQILELFANIDVNADRTLDWEEFLNYIVESGYSTGLPPAMGEAAAASAGSDANSYFAAKFAYRALTSPSDAAAVSNTVTSAAQRAAAEASSIFDIMTHASWHTEHDTDTLFVIGFRYRGVMVTALRFGQEMQMPVLLPYKRFRHDFAFQSHQVLQYCYVADAGQLVTCSEEFESGPSHLNFFNFEQGTLLRRVALGVPCVHLHYVPAMQLIYGLADEGGQVHAIDVPSGIIQSSFSQGESLFTSAIPVPGNLSGCLFVGTNEGSLAVWDLRVGKQVPAMRVLAHDYGIKALCYSETHSLMVSVGGPHPRRLQGLPAHVYAVLIWDVSHWVAECREGDAYQRALNKLRSKEGSEFSANRLRGRGNRRRSNSVDRAHSGSPDRSDADDDDDEDGGHHHPDRSSGAAGGRRRSKSSAAGAKRGAAMRSTGAASYRHSTIRNMRPRVLIGHRFPVTAVSIQEESGLSPHVVSVDEGGQVRVWSLLTGDCLQVLPLYSAPKLASSARGAVELGKAGIGAQGKGNGENGGDSGSCSPQPGSPARNGEAMSPEQKAGLVSILSNLSLAADGTGVSAASMISAAGPFSPSNYSTYGGGRRMSVSGGGDGASQQLGWAAAPQGAPANVDPAKLMRAGRRMSYSRASVMLYPSKGEGQAEMAVRALVAAGQLHSDVGGSNAVVEGILRTGNKYGVGIISRNSGFGSADNARHGVAQHTSSYGAAPPDGDDVMARASLNLSGLPAFQGHSLSNPPSALSTALSLVGLPSIVPEMSARRQRVMGAADLARSKTTSLAPSMSTERYLAASAASAATAFQKDMQKQAESALYAAGIPVGALSPTARKTMLQPLSPKSIAASPMAGAGDGSTARSRRTPAAALSSLGADQQQQGRVLGPNGNVLSTMLDLRLAGRRGSISDFALMLQQEAASQAGEDSEARRKQLSDATGGAKVIENKDGHSAVVDASGDDDGANRVPGGVPSFILLMPKAVGGHEKRNMMLIGGERTGITPAMSQQGGLATRHGMRVFTWMQDLPDREPLITAQFIGPSLAFMTATSAAIVIWDGLSGRPQRVFDNRLCDGKEISSAVLDKRQRKIIVGDVAGRQWVVNLVSGAVMKQLDPRASKPRKSVLAAQDLRRKALAAQAVSSALSSSSIMLQQQQQLMLTNGGQSTIDGGATTISVWKQGTVGTVGGKAGASMASLPLDGLQASSELAATGATRKQGGGSSNLLSSSDTAVLASPTKKAASHKKQPSLSSTNNNSSGGSGDSTGSSAYSAPIQLLFFSPRLEVLSSAGDGSVWLCEERSMGGWGYGSMTSTIVRIFPLPLEIYRAPAPALNSNQTIALYNSSSSYGNGNTISSVWDEPDPIISAVQRTNGYNYSTSFAADGNDRAYMLADSSSGGGIGVGAASSLASSSSSILPSIGGYGSVGDVDLTAGPSSSSSMVMPSSSSLIEGGASILSQQQQQPPPPHHQAARATSSSSSASSSSSESGRGGIGAHGSMPASQQQPASPSHDKPGAAPPASNLPALDGTIRVSCVTYSVRLNLLATCSRVLRDPPQTETEGGDADNDDGDDPNASLNSMMGGGDGGGGAGAAGGRGGSGGLVDDDSYVVLLFDYERATLIGACARAVNDRKGMPRHITERYNAASMLASLGATTITHNNNSTGGASDPLLSSLDPSQAPASGHNNGGSGSRSSLANSSDLLLPAATCMQFLDPFPALITAHDDGGIRIWAVPPSSMPFTLRMLYFLPANPSVAVYSRSVKRVAQSHAKRAMTNAAKRLVQKVETGGGIGSRVDGDGKGDRSESGPTGGLGGSNLNAPGRRGRRRSSVAGVDPAEVPALMQRRYAVSMATRPSLLTPPMRLGSLFPTGHAGYMPHGRVTPYAPAPPTQLFHEPNKTGGEGTGHADAKRFSLSLLKDPAHLHNLAAGPEGCTMWVGDTDGEVHRFFITSTALAAAGLVPVPPLALEETVVLERRLEDAPVHPQAVAVSLSWSRTQAKAWTSRQIRLAQSAAAYVRMAAGIAAGAASAGSGTALNLGACPVHPALLHFYAQAGRHPLFPVVSESLPPTALESIAAFDGLQSIIQDAIAAAGGDHGHADHHHSSAGAASSADATSGKPGLLALSGGKPKPVLPTPRRGSNIGGPVFVNPHPFSVTLADKPLHHNHQINGTSSGTGAAAAGAIGGSGTGLALCGPPGVVWEGSWRAHAAGDVVSLTALADSGFHGVLTGGQDGLARLWDSDGRLVGSLDPQPRFTAPMPDWESHDALPELLAKTMAAAAAAAADRENGKDDDAFSVPSDLSDGEGGASSARHHRHHSAGGTSARGNGIGTTASGAVPSMPPTEYGPGCGSGYSFDKWSMTHVATDRVYDGRSVYIPAGAVVGTSGSNNANPDNAAGTARSLSDPISRLVGISPSPVVSPVAASSPLSPDEQASASAAAAAASAGAGATLLYPSSLYEVLPAAWRPRSHVLTSPRAGVQPSLLSPSASHHRHATPSFTSVRILVHHIPSDSAVTVLQSVMLMGEGSGASGSDPHGASSAGGKAGVRQGRRRSSVAGGAGGMNSGGAGGLGLGLSLAITLPLNTNAGSNNGNGSGAFGNQSSPLRRSSITHGNRSISGGNNVNNSGAAGNLGHIISPTGVVGGSIGHGVVGGSSKIAAAGGLVGPREAGLYYSALAPPQRQVLWHVEWDLVMRRREQLSAANQALSLVKLVKLREFSGWGRRSSLIKSAARRLSNAMLEMAGMDADGRPIDVHASLSMVQASMDAPILAAGASAGGDAGGGGAGAGADGNPSSTASPGVNPLKRGQSRLAAILSGRPRQPDDSSAGGSATSTPKPAPAPAESAPAAAASAAPPSASPSPGGILKPSSKASSPIPPGRVLRRPSQLDVASILLDPRKTQGMHLKDGINSSGGNNSNNSAVMSGTGVVMNSARLDSSRLNTTPLATAIAKTAMSMVQDAANAAAERDRDNNDSSVDAGGASSARKKPVKSVRIQEASVIGHEEHGGRRTSMVGSAPHSSSTGSGSGGAGAMTSPGRGSGGGIMKAPNSGHRMPKPLDMSPFAVVLREDPVAATLQELARDSKREHALGLDKPLAQLRAASTSASSLKGPLLAARMRQEAARDALARRRSDREADEKQRQKKQQQRRRRGANGNGSDGGDGDDGDVDEYEDEEDKEEGTGVYGSASASEEHHDTLSSLVASVRLRSVQSSPAL